MILYNVTSSVDPEIAEEWVEYVRNVHMPEVMATGFFVKHQLCQLLNEENDGYTYAAQFYAIGLEQLETYQEAFAPGLDATLETRFPGQFISFRTVLEIID